MFDRDSKHKKSGQSLATSVKAFDGMSLCVGTGNGPQQEPHAPSLHSMGTMITEQRVHGILGGEDRAICVRVKVEQYAGLKIRRIVRMHVSITRSTL